MPIAVYFHPRSLSASQYDEAIKELEAAGAGHPAARLYHACSGSDGGLMVFEVWESQQAFEDYGQVLMPILAQAGIDAGAPEVMPVHNLVL
jgi:quinol monooxygenase YgiN